MEVKASPQTIADYCLSYERNEITINKDYQRSDRVWPSQARSFLIETICLGYPVPKFILNQQVNYRTKQPTKEIIDGQQRTKAITDFYGNKLRLSKTLGLESIKGRTYEELDEEDQGRFLNFVLDIDLFVGAPFTSVVEAFRRMNSYTFPLNAEERRHARYQRGIKWAIFYFCRQYEEYFRVAAVYAEKALVRMSDTKLIAEIWDALENGIRTTKSPQLDKLYRIHDVDQFDPDPYQTYLAYAFDRLQNWPDLFGSSLCRPHMIYALALALIHVHYDIDRLRPVFRSPKLAKIDEKRSIRNLTTLATAFEAKDDTGPFKSFVDASSGMTNVDSQRKIRFKWFCEALTKEL